MPDETNTGIHVLKDNCEKNTARVYRPSVMIAISQTLFEIERLSSVPKRKKPTANISHAVVLEQISYWLGKSKYVHDKKYWVRKSIKSFGEELGLNEEQLRYYLRDLRLCRIVKSMRDPDNKYSNYRCWTIEEKNFTMMMEDPTFYALAAWTRNQEEEAERTTGNSTEATGNSHGANREFPVPDNGNSHRPVNKTKKTTEERLRKEGKSAAEKSSSAAPQAPLFSPAPRSGNNSVAQPGIPGRDNNYTIPPFHELVESLSNDSI